MTQRQILRLIFGTLIAGVVGWGLWLSGGPGYNRMLREDAARRNGVENASQLVETYAQMKGALPESLEAARRFCDETPSRYCPEVTVEDYDYRPLETKAESARFEICANFALPSRPNVARHAHQAGRACHAFETRLKPPGEE